MKLSFTLIDSYGISYVLIDFERAHIFHTIQWEFSLVWPELMIVDDS